MAFDVDSNTLQDFLNQELLKLDRSTEITKQGWYCVHKVCFETVIDQHSTYRDLLSRIKAEYEECIEAIERGQREATYLSGKLAATVMEPETIRNFRRRRNELELKIGLLKLLNDRISSKQVRTSYRNSSASAAGSLLTWELSRNSNILPTWTPEQLTDTTFLTKKLSDLQSRVAQVKLEDKTRFVPKGLKGQLFNRLQEKEEVKEKLLSKREELKMRIMCIKLSMTEADRKKPKAYRGAFGNFGLVFRQTREIMAKADEMCEETTEEPSPSRSSQTASRILGEQDVPTKDREAEFILEYIENFFELFEGGKVEEAPLLAAYSPKGVLRTMETLEKFKEYDATHNGSSVFVAYWEALLATVATGCQKPLEWEAMECIKCVLEKGRVDLLTHWIAQDQLTLSEEAGRLISDACRCPDRCTCGLIGLAEAVFESVGAYKEVLTCFLRQGRYHTALEYSKNNSTLRRMDFLEAFQNVPLSDSILSLLCGKYTENSIFTVQEAEEILSHVLVSYACRRAARTINGGLKKDMRNIY